MLCYRVCWVVLCSVNVFPGVIRCHRVFSTRWIHGFIGCHTQSYGVLHRAKPFYLLHSATSCNVTLTTKNAALHSVRGVIPYNPCVVTGPFRLVLICAPRFNQGGTSGDGVDVGYTSSSSFLYFFFRFTLDGLLKKREGLWGMRFEILATLAHSRSQRPRSFWSAPGIETKPECPRFTDSLSNMTNLIG